MNERNIVIISEWLRKQQLILLVNDHWYLGNRVQKYMYTRRTSRADITCSQIVMLTNGNAMYTFQSVANISIRIVWRETNWTRRQCSHQDSYEDWRRTITPQGLDVQSSVMIYFILNVCVSRPTDSEKGNWIILEKTDFFVQKGTGFSRIVTIQIQWVRVVRHRCIPTQTSRVESYGCVFVTTRGKCARRTICSTEFVVNWKTEWT